MLIRNNPELDWDALEADINRRLAAYRERGDWVSPPEFGAAAKEGGAKRPSPTGTQRPQAMLAKLYALDDSAFVRRAHRLLLGRNPTPAELAQRLDALRAGQNKSRLVYQLRYSAEGKARESGINVPLHRVAYTLMAIPGLGRVFELLFDLLSVSGLRQRMQAEVNALQRALASQDDAQTRHIDNQSAALRAELDELRRDAALLASQQQVVLLEQQLGTLKMRLTQLESSASRQAPEEKPAVDEHAASEPAIEPAFYVALEDAFRGSEASIRERLTHYLPRLQDLPALARASAAAPDGQQHAVVDLGSGRGEWLSLLADHGIRATGIDTNTANIEHCRERGLDVIGADALTWLAGQPDNSIAAITAFHLIEHLPFGVAQALVAQAARCLVPGGLLLLETPNPENLLVASSSFHLDPTHLKPIPPALLDFLLDYCGFTDIAIERLHPVDEHLMLPDSGEVSRRCNHLFYAAQDYAVTGRKASS